jgi:hypothetical protein
LAFVASYCPKQYEISVNPRLECKIYSTYTEATTKSPPESAIERALVPLR